MLNSHTTSAYLFIWLIVVENKVVTVFSNNGNYDYSNIKLLRLFFEILLLSPIQHLLADKCKDNSRLITPKNILLTWNIFDNGLKIRSEILRLFLCLLFPWLYFYFKLARIFFFGVVITLYFSPSQAYIPLPWKSICRRFLSQQDKIDSENIYSHCLCLFLTQDTVVI